MADLLYPDNSNREARMYELTDDIGTLMNDLANDAADIKNLTEKLDETTKKMYKDIEVDIPPSRMKTFDYKGWVVEVMDVLEPFITIPLATKALSKCAVSYLLREDRIAEAAFYDLIQGITWLKFGVAAGAVVITVGLELGIDGIAGAVKRSKLRDAIHSAVQPRITLKQAAIVNGKIRDKLNSVVDACQMMLQLGYTQEQLDQAQKNIAAEFKEEVSTITEETAKSQLADLDNNRGSWTNEDN